MCIVSCQAVLSEQVLGDHIVGGRADGVPDEHEKEHVVSVCYAITGVPLLELRLKDSVLEYDTVKRFCRDGV